MALDTENDHEIEIREGSNSRLESPPVPPPKPDRLSSNYSPPSISRSTNYTTSSRETDSLVRNPPQKDGGCCILI